MLYGVIEIENAALEYNTAVLEFQSAILDFENSGLSFDITASLYSGAALSKGPRKVTAAFSNYHTRAPFSISRTALRN